MTKAQAVLSVFRASRKIPILVRIFGVSRQYFFILSNVHADAKPSLKTIALLEPLIPASYWIHEASPEFKDLFIANFPQILNSLLLSESASLLKGAPQPVPLPSNDFGASLLSDGRIRIIEKE